MRVVGGHEFAELLRLAMFVAIDGTERPDVKFKAHVLPDYRILVESFMALETLPHRLMDSYEEFKNWSFQLLDAENDPSKPITSAKYLELFLLFRDDAFPANVLAPILELLHLESGQADFSRASILLIDRAWSDFDYEENAHRLWPYLTLYLGEAIRRAIDGDWIVVDVPPAGEDLQLSAKDGPRDVSFLMIRMLDDFEFADVINIYDDLVDHSNCE